MNRVTHIGSYGLILNGDNIVLIKKVGGPYDGKLDLPGGTIEFNETPADTLKRELYEETGIKITNYELLDGNSINISWTHKGEIEEIHHIGFFYLIKDYQGSINNNILIDNKNDDSSGAIFYNIYDLKREELSSIAILEIEKLGYKLN